MSLAAIRSALETHLVATLAGVDIAFENAPYTPVAGRPYAAAYVMLAQPDNAEIGPAFTDLGIFQVSLFYPQNGGPAAAQAAAELIRTGFPFRSTLVSGGFAVNIIATPEVAPARAVDDRFLVPVKVRFQARGG
jgi:hypothetical protein